MFPHQLVLGCLPYPLTWVCSLQLACVPEPFYFSLEDEGSLFL
jgi:hypothetical protein